MDKMQELVQSLTGKSTKMVKVGKWMVAKEIYDFIVNEQKVIDDANLEKIVSSWKEEEEYWIKRNKELIDKAYEWLKTNYGHFDGSLDDLLVDFRKAMEE